MYNTYKFPGKFEKFVTVFTDAPDQHEARIDIVGYVQAIPMGVVEVKPRKFSAGDVVVGQKAERHIVVKNVGDKEFEVTKVFSKKHHTIYFDATVDQKVVIHPGQSKSFPITITAIKAGRYLDYVMIYANARNVTAKGYKVVVVAQAE